MRGARGYRRTDAPPQREHDESRDEGQGDAEPVAEVEPDHDHEKARQQDGRRCS